MATVKGIGPGSAFKIGLVLYAAVGLLVGIVWALFWVIAGSLGSMASAGAPGAARFFGFGMGVGAIIIFPICYGILGGVTAAISAALYNLVVGGAAAWSLRLTEKSLPCGPSISGSDPTPVTFDSSSKCDRRISLASTRR